MRVDELAPSKGAKKKPKRVGRGIGGKGGKTAGRGTKGQYARNTVKRGFEGGQMPLKQRVPKLKGFNNPFRVEFYAVNLDVIEALGLAEVDPKVLVDRSAQAVGQATPSTSTHCKEPLASGLFVCAIGRSSLRSGGRLGDRAQ